MRFESVPAGENRQLNGPWFGVRVLASGPGASIVVDAIALPLLALPALRREIDRITLRGPIYIVLAEEPGENVEAAAASPPARLDAGIVLYQSHDLAGAASADSGVLDLSGVRYLLAVLDNTGSGSQKAFGFTFYADDGATVIDANPAFHTVAANVRARVAFGPGCTSVTGSNVNAAINAPLPPRGRFTLAAAGATPGRLWILGRS